MPAKRSKSSAVKTKKLDKSHMAGWLAFQSNVKFRAKNAKQHFAPAAITNFETTGASTFRSRIHDPTRANRRRIPDALSKTLERRNDVSHNQGETAIITNFDSDWLTVSAD